ncbi:MAG: tetraacyldisaccharide 4'-kinase [Betaproteobacteria bacterium]|nr:tetraacyldisaccharide 4'-kinase [Betaproteobacteria bacterium]
MKAAPAFWNSLGPLALALLPLASLYALVMEGRRELYLRGWKKTLRLPVPVVVVGNITVGGTGKTPLIVWLAHGLARRGYRPGIVTRGYGGSGKGESEVRPDSDPGDAGDETVLLARRSGCPVWRGADRVAAGRALLAAHPECDCILSDDGLQHYRLARRVEIAVVDGARGFGNRLPLPAGPLREPVDRLEQVDAVVINGPGEVPVPAGFAMRLSGEKLVNMVQGHRVRDLAAKAGTKVHAVAGIGNPDRFFRTLRAAGLEVTEHAFPDHHRFTPADLDFGDDLPVIMTEKDAVKCFGFAAEHWWYLPVAASADPALLDVVTTRLGAPRTLPAR